MKTIYILTQGETTIGVFDSIELASFTKEQWDRGACWGSEKVTIEEYTLNYCWELQRVLTEQDKPETVIDLSTLFVRGHGVE